MTQYRLLTLIAALLPACTGGDGGSNDDIEDPGLAVLGGNTHSADGVEIEEIATSEDGLDRPMDVAFHPDHPAQLWIVNQGGPSVTVVDEVGTEDRDSWVASGDCTEHFMAEPSALAFGTDGFLATSHETDVSTPCTGDGPGDFMGPTLWIADPDEFNADWASHYDMLHNSPDAVGIAWEEANVYWVFDGYNQALTRYDFEGDHGGGGEDHSDAVVRRYVEGEVGYVAGVASHLVFDADLSLLYAADAGNGRVAVLDPATGEEGGRINPNYDGSDQREVEDADLRTFVDGAEHGLERPAGIALANGAIYVVDNASGRIAAFDLDGQVIDWLDPGLGEGTLMGIAVDAEGSLYVADADGDRVLRISAKAGQP